MSFKGMNPSEGRDVATEITDAGSRIVDAFDTATASVNGVDWIGEDYENFKGDWNGFISGAVAALQDALANKGNELRGHADEQDTTSNNG